jgi:uncharacterized Tic20 family protein
MRRLITDFENDRNINTVVILRNEVIIILPFVLSLLSVLLLLTASDHLIVISLVSVLLLLTASDHLIVISLVFVLLLLTASDHFMFRSRQ